MASNHPPRFLDRILEWYCSEEYLEDLQGDLHEYYRRRRKSSSAFKSSLFYLLDIVRNFKPFLLKKIGSFDFRKSSILFNNLKSVKRNLWRYKLYSSINIIGLAISMAASLMVWQYIKHELSYEDFHSNSDRIFRLTSKYSNDTGFEVHWARTPDDWVNNLVADLPEVENQVRFQNYYPRIIKVGDKSFKEPFAFSTDPEVFRVFDFDLLSGNPANALKEPYSVVLTERIARKFFGSIDVVGKNIEILNPADTLEIFKVTGVMRDLPGNTHLPINLLTSFSGMDKRRGWAYNYLLVNQGTLITDMQKRVESLVPNYLDSDFEGKSELILQELKSIHLHSDLAREIVPNGNIYYVKIFSAVAVFLLLMAVINFTNLSTSKSLERSKEVGIRKVLGSTRSSLFSYFILEAVSYAVISGIVALILVFSLAPTFFQLSGVEIKIEPDLFLSLLGLAIATGFLSGIYPAIIMSEFKAIRALKGQVHGKVHGKSGLRKVLISIQFIISLIILSSALITGKQFDFIQSKNLGYDKEQVLAITNSPGVVQGDYKRLRSTFMNIPGVLGMTANMEVPSREIRDTGPVYFEDMAESDNQIVMDIQVADTNFIDFMQMELLAGRTFSESLRLQKGPPDGSPAEAYEDHIRNSRREYVINETAMKLLGVNDPAEIIGKDLAWMGYYNLQKGPVVGVVKDFHQESLRNKVDPVVMVFEPIWLRTFLIKIEGEEMRQTLAAIDNEWKELFPSVPMEASFLDDLFNKLYQAEQRQKEILSLFSYLVILIALLGLLGLISFTLQQRTKELAIRKILGASKISIINLFGKSFIQQALFATILASPVSYYAMRQWLDNFAYRIEISWIDFLVSFLLLTFVLGGVVLVKVLKSTSLNPVETLKYE